MKLTELRELLDAETIQGESSNSDIACAYTSDLLSDVLAHASPGCALITIQAHRNAVAVASVVGAAAIVICNSRPIPDDMAEAAKNEGIALFRTSENQFEVSGRIWSALH